MNRGTQYKPPNILILIMGIPKMVPLIFGNPHLGQAPSSKTEALTVQREAVASDEVPMQVFRLTVGA